MNSQFTFTLSKDIKIPFVEKHFQKGQELKLVKLDLMAEEPFAVVQDIKMNQSWGLHINQIVKDIV